jgi:uncharacterized damage-inducible protein DinB
MTILERLLRHDAWTTRALLDRAAALSDAELDKEFDIAHRSLRRSFRHIIANMECWCDLMTGKAQRDSINAKQSNSIAELTHRLDIVAAELLALGKKVTDEKREDDYFVDYLDNPPTKKTLGAGLVHLATHGMHHRAQCLYIMRLLGMKDLIEGDALSWEQNHRGLENWPLADKPKM